MNRPRSTWWQCGLIGGVTFSFATLIKASRSIPRLLRGDEEWTELPTFAIAAVALGFVFGAVVGILWRLSRANSSASDEISGEALTDESPRTHRVQFGMRGLLIAVAVCAAALTAGRWVWNFVYNVQDPKIVVQAAEARGWMEPTLNGREILVADMNAYWKTKPQRWEIVVLRWPKKPNKSWLLRVIGLPGETVSFSEGKLIIDGKPMFPPPHLHKLRFHCDVPDFEFVPHPYSVPDGYYYLLGDNPDQANDSRLRGALPEAEILGRYPFTTPGTAQRLD